MIAIVLLILLSLVAALAADDPLLCLPGTKKDPSDSTGSSCVSLENRDVMSAMHFMAYPPRVKCNKETIIQGLSVCEDDLPPNCLIWSVISTYWCDELGSLAFEKYWSQRCEVRLIQFTAYFKGNSCTRPATKTKGEWEGFPNLLAERYDLFAKHCYSCLYSVISLPLDRTVNVLKLSERDLPKGIIDELEGVQYTYLSDLLIRAPGIEASIDQIVMRVTYNTYTMFDSVGREAEHMWNMWGAQQFLDSFAVFYQRTEEGFPSLQPSQFENYLQQVQLNTSISHYIQSYRRISTEEKAKNLVVKSSWEPTVLPKILGNVPKYCTEPSAEDLNFMHEWIDEQLKIRCHPTRLWVNCERRSYDTFIPCPQDLMNALAEDFSAGRGWCNYKSPYAAIEPLNVPQEVSAAFQKPRLEDGSVRIAFLFIVHTDAEFVTRLLDRLYSEKHYYLVHIDPFASKDFVNAMKKIASERPNLFIVQDVIIVYGASTVTILLSRSMAWFAAHATGWDYLMPVSGSDYPLVPLPRIEKILAHPKPHMPFVMAWTAGTQTHIFRLGKTHPRFEEDQQLKSSIEVLNIERGKILGQVPMEFRSGNFGPPLTCKNQRGFAHLDNRRNDTGRFDTQWLFPRDPWPRRGRANADEDPKIVVPPVDGKFRVWKKSDPAFTAAYDKETVEYIVNSEEGRKYWHFFKHMLLASEEHYYVTLLYNWPRTKKFISSLSAQSVWNTWELGLPNEMNGGFKTHTHYLSMKEFGYLEGMSRRGVFFARKFSLKKNRNILDLIDEKFLLNKTSIAGLEWPGFFEVDMESIGRQWVMKYNKMKAEERLKKRKGARDT